jgi:hypothetical protein
MARLLAAGMAAALPLPGPPRPGPRTSASNEGPRNRDGPHVVWQRTPLRDLDHRLSPLPSQQRAHDPGGRHPLLQPLFQRERGGVARVQRRLGPVASVRERTGCDQHSGLGP